MINKNRLYSLISFTMIATMVCSSSRTFHIQKYGGPNGNKAPPNIQLYQSLEPGMVLNVVASSTSNIINFNVFDVHGNRLYYVHPRMEQSIIGMNTHIGSWSTDVTTSKVPIKENEKYCLHIAYDSHGYRLFLNGEEIYFYKHRSQNNATEFGVEGEGKTFLMSYKLNEPKWAVWQTKNAVYIEEFGDDGVDTPYEIQLQGCNQLSSIAITGVIKDSAVSVDFTLMNSVGEKLLHFNPRFPENFVVRNSYLDSRWGKEEKSGAMVFQKNKRFTLAIDVEEDYYKTYVNGEDFITYKYRKPAHDRNITKLYISSDIKLFKIVYQN